MAEQELDKLLIEVDTQLTSLKGIESATTALEGLGRFAQNASKGVSSLKGMASALTQINEFGKSAESMDNAINGMNATVNMLKKLSKFTGNANKSIRQLKALGNALSSFNDVGKRLDGIAQVSKGVDKMADILKKLGDFDKDVSKGTSALKDLGDALQHFNGLDDNVKSLNDVALGLINISKATQAMQGLNKKTDVKYISNIADALKAFDGILTGRQYANVANITSSIAQLVTALSSTKDINVGSIENLGNAIKNTFNNAEFTQSAGKITSSLNALSKAYGVIGTQASSVDATMTKMVSSFSTASDAFYKIRENIEAIAMDFEEALKPVTNSALFDTLEQFKRLNDSYKNVGGLGQGLGQLLDTLNRLNGKTVEIKPLTDVFNKLDAFAKSKDVEEIGRKFEKVGNLAQPVASLMNALKYTDLKAENPSLATLGAQLEAFYDALPTERGFNEASYTLNAIKNLIDIAKQGGDLPKDNAITTLADSLGGFGKLMIPNLKDFVQEVRELVQFLSSLEEGFQLNVQPISDLLAVLEYSENASRASEVLVNTLSRIQMLEKVNIDKLNEVTGALNNLVFVLSYLNGVNTNGLRDIGYFIRSFANVKDMDAAQLNTIADGLTRIFEALGNVQAVNSNFRISLDASGVANFREVVNHTHREFEDFAEHMEESLQNINIADAFNFDAPLRDLQRQLRQAERSYEATMRRINQYQENMDRTESRMANPEDSQRYREQAMRLAQAREEARQYQEVIARLNDTIHNYRGFDFQNQGQALQFIDRLRNEYQRYEEILRDFHNAEITAAPDSELGIGFEAIRRRMEIIQEQIEQANEEFESMGDTIEGNAAIASRFADQLRRGAEEAERINQEMRNNVGDGFGSFGRALSGTGSKFLGSLGNLSSMFGQAVQNGTAQMSAESMASLTELAGTLGTVATAIGQIGAVVGVVIAAFKAWWDISTKVKDALVKFVQSAVQFSKNMLSHVVGAFNAVAGAVSKVVSAVKSGAEIIVSALRKIEEVGNRIKSFLGTLGTASVIALKGFKTILSAVTPRFVKNLASADFSLKSIIKNTRILSKLIKTVTRYFSMMSRMLMRKSITAFLKELKQAFEDLVLFEKNAGDEMLKLNTNVSLIFSGLRRAANQWIAAFEPLVNFFTPMIVGFLDGVQSMGEAVAKFMAILTGQGYYIRAKRFYEDWGQELEDTNKKVKNLTNGLDELNILSDDKEEPVDYSKYFEKVPVDGALDLPTLDDLIDKIVEWLKNIDWEKIWAKIQEFIYKLMDMINEILSRIDLWEWLGKTLGNLFNTLMHIWNDFIVKFDPKLLADAISTLIINALQTIDWDLIHENIELTAQKFAQFWNEIFSNQELWDEIAKAVTNILNEIVHFFDTWAWTFDFKQMATALTESITKILQNFDYEQLRHAVEGWVTGLADFINRVISDKEFWRTIGTSLAEIINAVLIEALKDIGKINLAELGDSIKQAIIKAIDNINWDELNEVIENLVKKITFAINEFFTDDEFLGKVASAIANLANTIINALDDLIVRIKAYDIATSIGEALKKLLGDIDWETVFKLPADAINKLSDAIRGLLNSIPKDFNLGTWLAEHLKITLNETDWSLIKKNVEELGKKIAEFISGLLGDKEFWTKLGETTGIVLDIGLNFIYNIFNINGEDLGTAISNYINGLLSKFDIGDVFRKTVDVALNIVVALDVALTGTDWGKLGDQIAQGIVDAVNKIYQNKNLIRKTIEDAFSSFNTVIATVLQKMAANGSFYKIGQTIGEVILAVITGVSEFFDMNLDYVLEAMEQIGNSLADFLRKHRNEIVKKLNTIIDAIVEIIDGFFDNKSKLFQEINAIIERLHLGKLLGSLIGIVLRKLTAKLAQFDAIMTAIKDDLDAFLEELWKAVKKLLAYIGNWIVKKLFSYVPLNVKLGEALASAILKMFGIKNNTLNIKDIFEKLKITGGDKAGGTLLDKIKKALFGENGKMFEATGGGLIGWIKSLFGKEEKLDIPVTVTPEVEEADSWEDLFDDEKTIPITLEDPTLGTITCEKIDVEEIYADVLYVGEIFADVLHVGEIDGNMEGFKKMEEYFGENEQDVSGGQLTNEIKLNGDEFLEKLKELSDEILEKLQLIVDDLNEKLIAILDDLEERLKKHLNKLTKALDKFLTKLNKKLEKFLKDIDKLDWKGYGKKFAEGFNEVVNIWGDGIDEVSNFADLFFSDEDGIEFSHRLERLLKGIKQFLKDVQDAIDESGKFIDMFFSDEDGIEISHRLERLLKGIKQFLKDVLDAVKKFKEDVEELFEDLGEDLFGSLKEDAEKALEETLEVFREYVDKLLEEVDKLKEAFDTLFDGLSDNAELEWGNLYDKISEWIDKIIGLFDKLNTQLSVTLAGLADEADEVMSKVYDVFEKWVDKIQELLNSLEVDFGFADELNDAYDDADKFIERLRALLKDLFDDFDETVFHAELIKVKELQVDNAYIDTIYAKKMELAWLHCIDVLFDTLTIGKIKAGFLELENGIKAPTLTVDSIKADTIFANWLKVEIFELNKNIENLNDTYTNHGKNISDNTGALRDLTRTIRDGGGWCVCNCGFDASGIIDAINDQTKALSSAVYTTGGFGGTGDFGQKFLDAISDLNKNLGNFASTVRDSMSNISCNCNCGGDCGKCSLGNVGTIVVNGDLIVNGNVVANGGIGNTGEGGYNPPKNVDGGDGNGDGDNKKNTPTGEEKQNEPSNENDVKPETNYAGNDGAEGGKLDEPKQEEEKPILAVRVPTGDLMTYADIKDANGNVIGKDDVTSEEEAKRYGVLDQFIANRDEANRRVEQWRNEAKSYYDTVMASGSESDKAAAQRNYDFLMSNNNQFGQDSYKNALEALKYYASATDAKSSPESFADKAKQVYEEIMNNPNATDYQKTMAGVQYNNVLQRTTKDSLYYNPSGAASFYSNLLTLRDEIKNANAEDNIKKQGIRIGMNDKVATYYTPNSSSDISASTRQALATAIFYDKDLKGKAVSWFLGSNTNSSQAVSDSATIDSMKKILKDKYGITEEDLPKGYVDKYINKTSGSNATATSDKSTVAVTPTSSTSSEAKPVNASETSKLVEAVKSAETASAKASSDGAKSSIEMFKEALDSDADFELTGTTNSTNNKGQNFSVNIKSGKDQKLSSLNASKASSLSTSDFNEKFKNVNVKANGVTISNPNEAKQAFDLWYQRFQAKGYQMGGLPKSGEVFISRENGTPEFVGSFGNSTAVANNEQIVTAVANGVSMANDRMVSAIENQTSRLESVIENKNLEVSIGDRQIAEANRRGQNSLGNKFID